MATSHFSAIGFSKISVTFELIDVDIEQRELFATLGPPQLSFDLFAEQHPVRQIGQRVVLRKAGDLKPTR